MTAGSVPPSAVPKAFADLYAVVLHHRRGWRYRVRWSSAQMGWLRSRDYGAGWHRAPGLLDGEPDAPDPEELAGAIGLAQRVAPGHPCGRCGGEDPGQHFVAPNVFGDPILYCVQMPSYEVVASPGFQGRKKHWGSPWGCVSVGSTSASDWQRADGVDHPVAWYLYGEPLRADEVIDLEWCSRCTGAAHNRRERIESSNDEQKDRDHLDRRVRADTRRLRRDMGLYYGEDEAFR